MAQGLLAMKKTAMANAVERLLAETEWLPVPLRTVGQLWVSLAVMWPPSCFAGQPGRPVSSLLA